MLVVAQIKRSIWPDAFERSGRENEPPAASSSRAQNEPEVDGKRLCREDEPPVVSRLQDPELSSRRDPWLKEDELSMEDQKMRQDRLGKINQQQPKGSPHPSHLRSCYRKQMQMVETAQDSVKKLVACFSFLKTLLWPENETYTTAQLAWSS